MHAAQPPLWVHRLAYRNSEQTFNVLAHHHRDDVLALNFKDINYRRGVGEKVAQLFLSGSKFVRRPLMLPPKPTLFQHPVDHRPQPAQSVFEQVIGGALFHRRDGDVLADRSGDYDEWNIETALLQNLQRP